MPFAATFGRPAALVLVSIMLCASALDAAPDPARKLDRVMKHRASLREGRSRVVLRIDPNASPEQIKTAVKRLGGRTRRALRLIDGYSIELPNAALAALASAPWVAGVSEDRVIAATMERTSTTVGAAAVRQDLGYDGAGVGVAIIDSGVVPWHDDLTSTDGGTQRVERFVDFVSGLEMAYDDHGHGTHVAGIIGGNGYDSAGARTGIAPAARLIVLKVLDASGTGLISDVIAALDYIVENRAELNVRVVNLSIRAGVYESFETDPLTVAAERAVRAGIVVVAAGGNLGRTSNGTMQYGGVTAPGNAPWVITVGASTHAGTTDRTDDTVAPFSSRGPGAGGYAAKPDIVAPGVGIESLAAPDSTLYGTRASYLLSGTVPTTHPPYLSLSGTSMSAPAVTGTVALMMQANPSLTPNQVKAILQYTAEARADYDGLTQGAGFLNARGAVAVARYFASPAGGPFPSDSSWGRRVIWGNRLFAGGRLKADANAWSTSVRWGANTTPSGKDVRWGVICSTTSCVGDGAEWIPWGISSGSQNVVWGSLCGGNDCPEQQWSPGTVFGADEGVVWGLDNDAVVWGINDDGVVWGLTDDGVVWGLTEDGVVWGLDCPDTSCEPVVWGRP